ncbi:MAG: hypothetical protein JW751_11960 [Polyangiaceae bacterium]|nr:hypothetical protein [Polyangiaceae bacterium]
MLSLRHEHPALAIEDFAEASDVPLGTVKDWLSPPVDALDGTESQSPTIGTETDAGGRSSGGTLDRGRVLRVGEVARHLRRLLRPHLAARPGAAEARRHRGDPGGMR